MVGRPIFSSIAIIILAFVPVFALTGQEGKLFHPLAFTKTFAMIGAAFMAVTLVPVLCTYFLGGKLHDEDWNPIMRFLRRIYKPRSSGLYAIGRLRFRSRSCFSSARLLSPPTSVQSLCRL
jgi:Cu(I)/Ag(I) efflux system membrane protein CusA/SilA